MLRNKSSHLWNERVAVLYSRQQAYMLDDSSPTTAAAVHRRFQNAQTICSLTNPAMIAV